MRTMPTIIHADPFRSCGEGIEVPTITREEFHRRLAEIAGRALTAEETARADRMGDHHWTLRVVATELFSEEIVDRHFAPAGGQPAVETANARLIAAAPELLAACQHVLARLDLEPVGAIFPCSAMRDQLRTAIAKATGGGRV